MPSRCLIRFLKHCVYIYMYIYNAQIIQNRSHHQSWNCVSFKESALHLNDPSISHGTLILPHGSLILNLNMSNLTSDNANWQSHFICIPSLFAISIKLHFKLQLIFCKSNSEIKQSSIKFLIFDNRISSHFFLFFFVNRTQRSNYPM